MLRSLRLSCPFPQRVFVKRYLCSFDSGFDSKNRVPRLQRSPSGNVYRTPSGTLASAEVADELEKQNRKLVRRRQQNLDGLVHFRSLNAFIRTKKHVEHGSLRQAFLAHGFAMVRPIGAGTFGQVFLAKQLVGNRKSSVLKAIKVLDIGKAAKKDYDHSWLTAEERTQAQSDAKQILKEIQRLPPGVVQERMMKSHLDLLDYLKREQDPQQRRTRRPVAEQEILQRLSPHPFIANLEYSFRDRNALYMVFSYYNGGTLKELLAQNGGIFTEVDAKFYAAELVLGLLFLQENNVAHRDIKPANILLNTEGHVAVSDFGLATRLHGGLKTLCGTAEYIAPEVLSSKTWTSAYLDWWAFGVTVYELITGVTPFAGPDAQTVFLNILTAPLEFPPHVSDVAKDFLSKILSRDYSKRILGHEIVAHPFFREINFEQLNRRLISPPLRPSLPSQDEEPEVEKPEEVAAFLRRRPRIEFSFGDVNEREKR